MFIGHPKRYGFDYKTNDQLWTKLNINNNEQYYMWLEQKYVFNRWYAYIMYLVTEYVRDFFKEYPKTKEELKAMNMSEEWAQDEVDKIDSEKYDKVEKGSIRLDDFDIITILETIRNNIKSTYNLEAFGEKDLVCITIKKEESLYDLQTKIDEFKDHIGNDAEMVENNFTEL